MRDGILSATIVTTAGSSPGPRTGSERAGLAAVRENADLWRPAGATSTNPARNYATGPMAQTASPKTDIYDVASRLWETADERDVCRDPAETCPTIGPSSAGAQTRADSADRGAYRSAPGRRHPGRRPGPAPPATESRRSVHTLPLPRPTRTRPARAHDSHDRTPEPLSSLLCQGAIAMCGVRARGNGACALPRGQSGVCLGVRSVVGRWSGPADGLRTRRLPAEVVAWAVFARFVACGVRR